MIFSANLSLLFGEVPFLDRFERAAAAGFGAVEFWWPRGEELEAVEAAARDAELEVALFNFDAGDMAGGDRGLLSDPERAHLFRENVPVAVELARGLRCRKLNALVGTRVAELPRGEQLSLAAENVRWAARRVEAYGIEILIEAVNTFENGPYLLSRTEEAMDFVRTVGRPNVRLQYDAYHMQRMEGNLVANLRRYHPMIAHIQIADSPDRHEPGTGEINFRYVLEAIHELGYDGHVGLEYRPRSSTEDSLRWLPRHLRSGSVDPREAFAQGAAV